MSFAKTIDILDMGQKQEDVSIAYYFICVLHLANEKGLVLAGQDDLADFKIAKDETNNPVFGTFGEES